MKSRHINQVLKIFEYQLNSTLSLDYISHTCGCSPQYISRLFKVKYGTSPIDFLWTYRCYVASMILIIDNTQLENVKHLCGFRSSEHFCRRFKKTTGSTPKGFYNSKPCPKAKPLKATNYNYSKKHAIQLTELHYQNLYTNTQ